MSSSNNNNNNVNNNNNNNDDDNDDDDDLESQISEARKRADNLKERIKSKRQEYNDTSCMKPIPIKHTHNTHINWGRGVFFYFFFTSFLVLFFFYFLFFIFLFPY